MFILNCSRLTLVPGLTEIVKGTGDVWLMDVVWFTKPRQQEICRPFLSLGRGGGAYSRGDQPELAILSILLCLTPDDFTRQQVNALFVSKRFNNC